MIGNIRAINSKGHLNHEFLSVGLILQSYVMYIAIHRILQNLNEHYVVFYSVYVKVNIEAKMANKIAKMAPDSMKGMSFKSWNSVLIES